MNVTLTAETLELKRARVPRDPYVVALVATGSEEKPVRVACDPHRGARKGKTLELDLELYSGDPGDWVTATILVMESDDDFRRAGKIIGAAREHLKGTRLGQALRGALGIPTAGLAGIAIEEGVNLLAHRLRKAGDDEMARFVVKLKRGDDGWVARQWSEENHKVDLRLSLALSGELLVTEAEAAEDEEITVGDWVNWDSHGALVFPEPRQVARFDEADGERFAFVKWSDTGIPVDELVLIKKDDPLTKTPTRWSQVEVDEYVYGTDEEGAQHYGKVHATIDGGGAVLALEGGGTLTVERLADLELIVDDSEEDDGAGDVQD